MTMKKLIYILGIAAIAACSKVTETVYEQPSVEIKQGNTDVVRFQKDTIPDNTGGNTLELCCSIWKPATSSLYRCWTANGDCTDCYAWCEEISKTK